MATDGTELLRGASTILLIDWPSRDVPDSLARAGLQVTSEDGPGLYNAYQVDGVDVRRRRVEGRPARADLVYAHRPVDELTDIVEQAATLGARAVWLELGSPQARALVESAGLLYIDAPQIADAARAIG